MVSSPNRCGVLFAVVLSACSGRKEAQLPPSITSFSPSGGSPGTEVTIQGILFDNTVAGNTVRFNGSQAIVSSANSTSLAVVVPQGATTGRISVTTTGGTGTSDADFTLLTGTGSAWTTRLSGPRGRPAVVVWTGQRFVSAGGSEGYQVSQDGLNWRVTRPLTSASDLFWDGQMIVAASNSFTIDTSPDGLTWTPRSPPAGSFLQGTSVARSPAQWVMVGMSGGIISSADAVTWTLRQSGTTKNLTQVVWTGSQFVAVGADGAVVTSPDGETWTVRTPPTTDSFTALGASAALIVASTFPYAGSVSALWTSTDGVSWAQRYPGAGSFNDIIYANDKFAAVGSYRTGYSSDGISWTFDNTLYGLLDSVVFTGTQFLAVGVAPKDGSAVFRSSDGVSWTPIAGGASLNRIARRPSDGRLVVTGGDNRRVSSDNGSTWQVDYGTHSPSVGSPFLEVLWSPHANAFLALIQDAANQRLWSSPDGESCTRGNNVPCYAGMASNGDGSLLIAVGTSLIGSCLATSTDDGVTWTPRTPITMPTTGQRIANAFWTGTQFVGVGPAGALATSPDGVAWTARASNVTETLQGVAASTQGIVVVGSGGRIIGSVDGGITWTTRTSGTNATLNRVTWTGSDFYAVGSAGTVVRSSDGRAWTLLPTPYSAGSNAFSLNDAVWLPTADGQLLAAGSDGLIATSP